MDFENLFKQTTFKGGAFLSIAEAEKLDELARLCTGKGIIVEIGSFIGRSTIILATASMETCSAPIYAIDPHEGKVMDMETGSTLDLYFHNITEAGVHKIVKTFVMTSEEAAPKINEPIEFLFIDGDHHDLAVQSDFDNYFPKVIPGGIVAFHDCFSFGLPRFINGALQPFEKYFSSVGLADRLLYGIKK